MSLYRCGHCGGKTIMQSYWNNIPSLHCIMCGCCEDDAKGIYNIKTGLRTYSTPRGDKTKTHGYAWKMKREQ